MAQSPDLKDPLEAFARASVPRLSPSSACDFMDCRNEAALFRDPASNDHYSAAVRVDGRLYRSRQNACSRRLTGPSTPSVDRLIRGVGGDLAYDGADFNRAIGVGHRVGAGTTQCTERGVRFCDTLWICRGVLPAVELPQGIRPNRSRQELAEQTVIKGSQKKRFAEQNCCVAWYRSRDIACCSRA